VDGIKAGADREFADANFAARVATGDGSLTPCAADLSQQTGRGWVLALSAKAEATRRNPPLELRDQML